MGSIFKSFAIGFTLLFGIALVVLLFDYYPHFAIGGTMTILLILVSIAIGDGIRIEMKNK